MGASKTFSMDSFSMGCVDRITRSKQLGSKKSIFHTWYRTRHPILSPVGNRFFFFPTYSRDGIRISPQAMLRTDRILFRLPAAM